jgi:hypothetical protein
MKTDLRVKFQIASKLESVAEKVDGVLTYARGWSDARLAREFNTTAAIVAGVRKNILPDLQPQVPRQRVKKSKFSDLEARISALENILTTPRRAA